MKKLAFTIGDFDCINQDHIHLIKEMRKIAMPDNEVVVVLVDDYASFVNTRKFPIQDIHRRKNNLSFFVKESSIRFSLSPDPGYAIETTIELAKNSGLQPIFVAYDDNKEFTGRDILKKHNVSIRFIKKPYAKA